MKDARYVTVAMLVKTSKDGAYSNLLLAQGLEMEALSDGERALCTRLYYGVLERRPTLEYLTKQYCSRRLDTVVREILYLGLYQLLYCEKIPDHAAVSATVGLCRAFKKTSAAGLVNAVLRRCIRDGKTIPRVEDPIEQMAIDYATPRELLEALLVQYGEEWTRDFLANALLPPPCTIRSNPCRNLVNLEELNPCKRELAHCYDVHCADVTRTHAFREGMFHVQDYASQLCCQALTVEPGQSVLDVCAAPGGKSFTLAEVMENQGVLYAWDLHAHRVALIADGAKRLGLSCITLQVRDACVFHEDQPRVQRVLCDVPCSGLGVIRRKPELKYKSLSTHEELPELQYRILDNASRYLGKDGLLVYSTCTLLRRENEAVVERFLREHSEFCLEPMEQFEGRAMVTLSPREHNCDGFFFARMRRVRE